MVFVNDFMQNFNRVQIAKMSNQRATLVDHDELAELQDEPSVYGLGGNHDGQPSPILQVEHFGYLIRFDAYCRSYGKCQLSGHEL